MFAFSRLDKIDKMIMSLVFISEVLGASARLLKDQVDWLAQDDR